MKLFLNLNLKFDATLNVKLFVKPDMEKPYSSLAVLAEIFQGVGGNFLESLSLFFDNIVII